VLAASALAAGQARAACVDDIAQIEQKLNSGQMAPATGTPAGVSGGTAVEMRMSSGETRTVADAPAAPTSDRELAAGLEAARADARSGDESGSQERHRALALKTRAGVVEGAGPAASDRSGSAGQRSGRELRRERG